MTLVEAIDRLNSWVRSVSHGAWYWSNSPRMAIYDAKHAIIEQAIRNGLCICEAIRLMVHCRDCGGSGKYSSYGRQYDHCWRCSSTGKQTLEFVVTTIEGFRWHTPRDKSWRFKLPENFWQFSTLAMDWAPNQKGRDLELWEVAECLNVMEEARGAGRIPMPGKHSVYESGDYYGESDHSNYKLYLGDGPPTCEFCGVPGGRGDSNGTYHCVGRQFVSWSAYACNSCSAQFATSSQWSDGASSYVPSGGNGRSIFDEFKVPVDKLRHPEIEKWLARRGVTILEEAGVKGR